MQWTSKLASVLLASLLIAVIASGCGGGSDNSSSVEAGGSTTTSTASAGADQKVADEVPADIKSKGVLNIATDTTFPPFEFIGADSQAIEGIDPDMIKAIAEVMGLKADVKGVKFDAIIPGLAAGEYDIAISSFAVSAERMKVIDMVTYLAAGNSYVVNAKVDGTNLKGPNDLCGLRIAVLKGTTNAVEAHQLAKKCGGKTKVLDFPEQSAANLAVTSGRADVTSSIAPAAAYFADRSNGQLKVAGVNYDGSRPFGIAVPKGSGLAAPIRDAVQVLIDNGTYEKILAKWKSEAAALKKAPEVNPTEFGPTGASS